MFFVGMGIIPAEESFLKQIRELCNANDILLILDEIQCGMGRTGFYFAWQKFGIRPDIMTVAKAIAGGVPAGAFLMTEKVAENSLFAGDHGTTYGGNPLVGAAVNKVLDLFERNHIIDNVNLVSGYLEEQLDLIVKEYDFVQMRRGCGLMQGLVLDCPAGEIINKALENGLILINAGPNVIRFLPPLIIRKEHVDEMIGILRKCLS